MRTWFKEMRIKHQLTQSAIAKLAGVDVTTINKIELGIRRPSPELAKKIANVLEFSWTKFFDDEQDTSA